MEESGAKNEGRPQANEPNTDSQSMSRLTFRIPKENIEAIEKMVDDGIYPSRSEAIRDALRSKFNLSR